VQAQELHKLCSASSIILQMLTAHCRVSTWPSALFQ